MLTGYPAAPPNNFAGLPPEQSDYKTSPIVIWPIPLDRTTTFISGTRYGPRAILEASRNMETFDDEVWAEVCDRGIATLPEMETQEGSLEQVMANIRTVAGQLATEDKFVVALGGEHSLTGPVVSAYAKKHSDLTVLQVDAHADLREAYQQNRHSHASVMRRVIEICPAVQVGIRSLSKEEALALPELKTKIFWAKDIAGHPAEEWADQVVDELSDHVYVTLDLDGFDPAYLPATGTPEPGGLDWYQVTGLMRTLARKKKVVAMDVVELLPQPGEHASNFLAAKLIYKCLSYLFLKKS